MLKAKEIKKMSIEDLNARKEELSVEVFRMKVKKSTGDPKTGKLIKNMRHDIARINTILRQRLAEREVMNG